MKYRFHPLPILSFLAAVAALTAGCGKPPAGRQMGPAEVGTVTVAPRGSSSRPSSPAERRPSSWPRSARR